MNLTKMITPPSDPIGFAEVPNCLRPDSPIAFIGEAPGKEEVRVGRPFSGDSGYNLRNYAAPSGISVDQCSLLNVFTSHPPNNNISVFIDMRASVPKIAPGREHHLEELYKQLKSLPNLKVVVPLGEVALWALTGIKHITKYRGSVLWSDKINCKVIPTRHPSPKVVNEDWFMRYYIMQDLAKVARHSHFKETRCKERKLMVRPSFNEARSFIEYCKHAERSAFIGHDIETLGNKIDCWSLAPNDIEAMTVPFVVDGHDYFDPDQETLLWNSLADLLADEHIKKVFHNAMFDTSQEWKHYGIICRNTHDTMMMYAKLYAERKDEQKQGFARSLAALTSLYTDEPYYKDELPISTAVKDWDLRWRYCAKDSCVTVEIANALTRELESKDMMAQYERQRRLIEPFLIPNCIGLKVDEAEMKRQAEALDVSILEKVVAFQGLAGKDINPFSDQQLKKFFSEDISIPLPTKSVRAKDGSRSNKPTLDKHALYQLSTKEKTAEYANLIIDMRSTKKQYDYYNANTVNGRLITDMSPVGTETGRPTSGKTDYGEGGNILNLTSSFKKMIEPDEGFFFCEFDYRQAEAVIVAHLIAILGQDYTMLEVINRGFDIHRFTSTYILGWNASLNSSDEEIKALLDKVPKHVRDKQGKPANHSLNYKLGAISFSRRYRLPLTTGTHIHSTYYRTYPGLNHFHNWIDHAVNKSPKYLINCMGDRRDFYSRPGDDRTREGCAWNPQSTVASMINEFAVPTLYNDFPEAMFLNHVYDSVWFQASLKADPRVIAERMLHLKKSMESPIRWKDDEFCIYVDAKIGWNAGEKYDLVITDDIEQTANNILITLEEARNGEKTQ